MAEKKFRYGAPKNWREKFIVALGETSNISAAAEAADISLSWVYKTRREDPAFAARWHEALCEGYDNLEMQLLAYLRNGEPAEAGDTPKRKFDAAAAIRCLSAHRESVAREKGRRTLAHEAATIESINAKIDKLRLRAREGEAQVRKSKKAVAKRIRRNG